MKERNPETLEQFRGVLLRAKNKLENYEIERRRFKRELWIELGRKFAESGLSYSAAASLGVYSRSTLQAFSKAYDDAKLDGRLMDSSGILGDEQEAHESEWPETTWWEDGGFSLWRGYIVIKYHHIDDPEHPMLHVWGRSERPVLGQPDGARSIPLAPRGEAGVFLEGARAAIAKDPRIGYDFYSKAYGDFPTDEVAALLAKHPEFEYREYEVKG